MVTPTSFASIIGVTLSMLYLSNAQPVSTSQIAWSACTENVMSGIDCGTLAVPLDYAEPDGPKLNISMARTKHTKEPFLGSIFFNPGGPGLGARNLIDSSGATFMNMTGGQFDLIGHDPRGTGETIPITCWETDIERYAATNTYQATSKVNNATLGNAWASWKRFADTCAVAQNGTGTLVGSAYTARDIMAIVDALEEDGMLRFWGFSYGSALGSILAKMFPDRVDRIVIDGVLNMHQYYAAEDWGQVAAFDDAFSAFIAACAEAGPSKCALARSDKTAADLETEFYDLLEEVTYNPIPLGVTQADWINQLILKGLVSNGLRYPVAYWPLLAGAIDAINTRNLTAWQENGYTVLGALDQAASTFPELGTEAPGGIRASDTNPSIRTDDLESLLPLRDQFYNTSVIAGDSFFDTQAMLFRRWPMRAKEQVPFQGEEHIRTNHPILLIGNPLDHLTPLSAAYNTSANFEGSVVLQHDGLGHCSLGQQSLCTAKIVQSYFVNGTLPEPGTQCEPDVTPFLDEANLRKRDTLSSHEIELLEAMGKVRLF